ncbi:hypothetical protein GCM10011571_23780 [Marinithermofilum abyssi]|uniref:Uncharacterized protein n=1 Tax=Marinithermofilum abyssi TaxID=1571185 RepID=A0A8J2VJ14_9BACL|nr:hypothetical protein GCM10011571_23780 [Marinithermofilum abyssi]
MEGKAYPQLLAPISWADACGFRKNQVISTVKRQLPRKRELSFDSLLINESLHTNIQLMIS